MTLIREQHASWHPGQLGSFPSSPPAPMHQLQCGGARGRKGRATSIVQPEQPVVSISQHHPSPWMQLDIKNTSRALPIPNGEVKRTWSTGIVSTLNPLPEINLTLVLARSIGWFPSLTNSSIEDFQLWNSHADFKSPYFQLNVTLSRFLCHVFYVGTTCANNVVCGKIFAVHVYPEFRVIGPSHPAAIGVCSRACPDISKRNSRPLKTHETHLGRSSIPDPNKQFLIKK